MVEWLAVPKGRKTISQYLGPTDLSICEVFLFKYQKGIHIETATFSYLQRKERKRLWVLFEG